MAQQVAQSAVNREVEGSNPSVGANKTSPIRNRHSLRGCQGGLGEAISFKPSIKRPHRITAIMPACRAGDRGSTPLEVAKDCSIQS